MEIMEGVTLEDVMGEIGSMGVGNATTHLSEFFEKNPDAKKNLFDKELSITPSFFKYIKLKDIKEYFNKDNTAVLHNLRFDFKGNPANIMMIFPEHSSLLIPMLIRGKYLGKPEFTEMIFEEDFSTLYFVASIVVESFSNMLRSFLEIEAKESYTNTILLPEKKVTKFISAECGKDPHLILIKIDFQVIDTDFKCELYMIAVFSEIDTIVELIKKKYS